MSPKTRPASIPMVTARDVDRPETRCSVSSVVRPSSSGGKARPALLFSLDVFSFFFFRLFFSACFSENVLVIITQIKKNSKPEDFRRRLSLLLAFHAQDHVYEKQNNAEKHSPPKSGDRKSRNNLVRQPNQKHVNDDRKQPEGHDVYRQSQDQEDRFEKRVHQPQNHRGR